MNRFPLVVTVWLEEKTRSWINERVEPDRRLKTFSEFVREAIALRLDQTEIFDSWNRPPTIGSHNITTVADACLAAIQTVLASQRGA